jgi:predicted KAP-like P-loop ATPase
MVVGLTGKWGSGKSSTLASVSEQLSKLEDVSVVNFNPWIFQGRDDLISSFFSELSKQLGSSRYEKFRGIGNNISSYEDAIGAAASVILPGSGMLAKAAAKKLKRAEPSVAASRISLELKLRELKGNCRHYR